MSSAVHSRVTIHANRNIRHICHIIVATQGTNEWVEVFWLWDFTTPVDKYICPHVFDIFFWFNYACKEMSNKTRMHSSRMRTGRALTISGGGCIPAGFFLGGKRNWKKKEKKIFQTPRKIWSRHPPRKFGADPPENLEETPPPKIWSRHPPENLEQTPPRKFGADTPRKFGADTPPKNLEQTPPKIWSRHPPTIWSRHPPENLEQTAPPNLEQTPPQKFGADTPPENLEQTHTSPPKFGADTPPENLEETPPPENLEETSPPEISDPPLLTESQTRVKILPWPNFVAAGKN